MAFGRARSGGATPPRRGGPVDEERRWDPADQAIVEAPLLHRKAIGTRWLPAAMVNNIERLDPLGSDRASEAIRRARRARRLTALDEGQAWRHRKTKALLVARVEVFADEDGDDHGHRQAWRDHGLASLDATWRERWRDREIEPGWVEASFVATAERPDPLHAFAEVDPVPAPARSVDWYRIEDHTDPLGRTPAPVSIYEHLLVWAGRGHVTLTLRHELGAEGADAAALAAVAALDALARRLVRVDP